MSGDMPELQEREDLLSPHSHSDSEDGGRPGSPEEGLGSPQELKSEQPAEAGERVGSLNCPESKATAVLSSRELWQLFDTIGTEMIVTRRGRRMFPAIKVELYDLKPDVSYILLMDMAPVDKYRYKYNAGWVRCFEEECAPTRLYIHPDSPALGAHWTSIVINFYKLKLTNNQLDKQGHIIVNSMHRYQPRLHIVESDDINSFNWETRKTFIFPGTQFTTVTAYQNDKITQLKIQTNPFAKGFRTPFSRCRSRNAPGSCARFTLRSGSYSDSGLEDPPHPSPSSLSHSSPTSLLSPRLLSSHDSPCILLQGHDSTRFVVSSQEAPRVLVPGQDLQQLTLSAQDLQRLMQPRYDAQRVLQTGQEPQRIVLAGQDGKTILLGGQDQRLFLPGQDGQKVIVAGQNGHKLIFPGQEAQMLSLLAQQEAQVTRLMLGQNGQKIVLPWQNGQCVLQQNSQSLKADHSVLLPGQDRQRFVVSGQGQDSQSLIMLGPEGQKLVLPAQNVSEIAGRKRRHLGEELAGRKQACLSSLREPASHKLVSQAGAAGSEPMLVLMYRPVPASQQQPELLSQTLPHSRSSSYTGSNATYTVVAAPPEPRASSPQIVPASLPRFSTSHILASSPHAITSVPRIVTSTPHTVCSPLSLHTSATASPTVVNGLLHLKPAEGKSMQVLMSPSEGKKPPMDISCLTKEGVARVRTPPPLLQVQNKEKPAVLSAQKAGDTWQSPKSRTASSHGDEGKQPVQDRWAGRVGQLPVQPAKQVEARGGKGVEMVSRLGGRGARGAGQEVVLVQAAPRMQQVLVIGEKGEAVPQSQVVLPVAYDQQLVSMPIYRLGSSLSGLQPVQVLGSLPAGAGSITTA